MDTVTPEPPRFTVDDQGDVLAITIPAKRERFKLGLQIVFLLAWVAHVGAVLSMWLDGAVSMELWLVGWLCLWILIGVGVARWVLWQLTGRAVVAVSAVGIEITYTEGRFRRTRVYQAGRIRRLRTSQRICRHQLWVMFVTCYPLTFDYAGKTIRPSFELSDAESNQLLEIILARFPQYGGE